MKPANTGRNSVSAAEPIWLSRPANVSASAGSLASMSKAKEMAISRPPATTNGSMYDTPVMRCW